MYPSFKAILRYRLAHRLYLKKHYFLADMPPLYPFAGSTPECTSQPFPPELLSAGDSPSLSVALSATRLEEGVELSPRLREELKKIVPLSKIYLNEAV